MFRFSAAFLAVLTLSACGSSPSSSGGSAATGDTVSDSGAGTGDISKTDTGTGDTSKADSSSSGADVANQDTGQSSDEIAKQLAAAKKAESDLLQAFCKENLVCDTGLFWSNTAACQDYLKVEGGLVFFTDGLSAIAAGRATFDSASLAACIATFDAKCTFFNAPDVPAPCLALFKGLVDNNFACDRDLDCKSSYCYHSAANDPACVGTCKPKVATGAVCESNAQCPAGNICNADGKCAAIKAAVKGESCLDFACAEGLLCLAVGDTSPVCVEPGAAGATCTPYDYSCAAGLYCKAPDSDSDGVCTAAIKSGDGCDKDAWYNGGTENPCEKGYVCVDQPAGVTPTGATCKAMVKVGENCLSTDQCDGLDQECWEYQDGSMKCDYMPGKGEDCTPLSQDDLDAGYLDCLPPLVCDGTTSKCVDRPAAGKACIEAKCASGLVCNDTEKCSEPGKVGASCTTYTDGSSDCAAGLVCGAGDKCQTPICK